jgi:succinyl-CoA synthetase beta subunit
MKRNVLPAALGAPPSPRPFSPPDGKTAYLRICLTFPGFFITLVVARVNPNEKRGITLDLYEAEGIRLLRAYGIPVNEGVLYEPGQPPENVPLPCAVKAQVLGGKRGKAGGVKFAETPEELLAAVEAVQATTINGKPADALYLAPKLHILQEHYLGLTIDQTDKTVLLLYSPQGGMDIEELASAAPDRLFKLPLGLSFDRAAVEEGLRRFELSDAVREQLCRIAERLFRLFWEVDATTAEINPLAQTDEISLVAADAKIVLDDNAAFRRKDYTILSRRKRENENERKAREADLAYVELGGGGNIGVIAGGAGIGMATVDTILYYGGRPFNFLDLGGGVSREKTCAALSLLLHTREVEGVFVNVFGGINNCLTIAEGIRDAIRNTGSRKPVVVKSRGFSQEEGWKIYDELGLGQVRYGTTDDGVKLLLRRLEAKA